MIKYREHRGSLEDSLTTSKEYSSLTELFLNVHFDRIEHYAYDDRVKQNLFIVIRNSSPIGFIYEVIR